MKKYLILVIFSIFLIPLSGIVPLRGQPVWYGQYVGILFIFFLTGSLTIWKFNKYLSIFIAVCIFSVFQGFFVSFGQAIVKIFNNQAIVYQASINPRAILCLIQLEAGALIAYGISKFNKQHRKIILWAIIGFFILQTFWLGLQFFNEDPIFHSNLGGITDITKDELVGFSGAKDQLGTFYALTFPVILFLCYPLGLFSLAGVFVSESSFAIVALVCSGLFYILFAEGRRRFLIWLIILLLAFGMFLWKVEMPKPVDFQMRFAVWKHAIVCTHRGYIEIQRGENLRVHTNRYLGFGLGSFLQLFPYIPQRWVDSKFNYSNEKFTHAHNDFAEVFFELGYLGIISLFLLLGNLIYRFARAKKSKELALYTSCLIAYLFNSTGNFLVQIAISGMFLILFYGMFEGALNEG